MRHGAPVARVAGARAVVAHHEVAIPAGTTATSASVITADGSHVGLVEAVAVDEDDPVPFRDDLPWEADDALDEVPVSAQASTVLAGASKTTISPRFGSRKR